MTDADRPARSSGRGATLVALGILASRLMGLVRQRVFAHYLSTSALAGAFTAALRIPNVLQNLFGEGVLSASFIPVYARLLGEGRREDADRVASAVFGLLSLLVAVLVALGIFAAPSIVGVVVGGFAETGPAAFAKAVQLTRILFPSTGLLVLSAWCLGVLNSHRKFFLSYAAPVVWNLAQIAVLRRRRPAGRRGPADHAPRLGRGGGQRAAVRWCSCRCSGRCWDASGRRSTRPAPRCGRCSGASSRSWSPAAWCRSARWWTPTTPRSSRPQTVAVLGYTQLLALLPVSLFGMSVSAAELPELARETALGARRRSERLRTRIDRGLERIAFFVVPSAVAFLFLGDVLGGLLFQTGRFDAADTRWLWYLLMGSAVGLVAGTLGRLYASAFYALQDARTPLALRLGPGGALRAPWPTCRCGTGRAGSASRWRWAPWASPPPPGSPPGWSTSCSGGRLPVASAGPASRGGGWLWFWGSALAAGALALLGKAFSPTRLGPAPR